MKQEFQNYTSLAEFTVPDRPKFLVGELYPLPVSLGAQLQSRGLVEVTKPKVSASRKKEEDQKNK